MRKNLALLVVVVFLEILTGCGASQGQSYTTITDEGVEIEFTIITKEQFDRIRISNENSAVSVLVDFYDNTQATTSKVIKGTRPKYYGMTYQSIKANPPNSNELVWIRYNNGDKCSMNVSFYNKQFSYTISLAQNRAEYIRQYNLYTDMVKNAK
ncbi:MAG: hypothetical protein Ta2B_16110 [Termitinemataceae bacterium]|nr:MAG: hypothetical protein Ta2B_16110 [Termitinemataceae bacterium]